MALKPTIYKANLQLADSDRHVYESFSLTLAQHPSETLERMVVRLLAFALNASDKLSFTKGLSSAEEPDLWAREDNGTLSLWIEVGQPKPERVKKALGLARQVAVYGFGKALDTWWNLEGKDMPDSERLSLQRFQWADIQSLAANVGRAINWSVTIAGGEVYVDDGVGSHHLVVDVLA